MNNKSFKLYIVGFVAWLVLIVVSVIVFRFTAFVPESTHIATDDGESFTEELRPFSVIVLKQINNEIETSSEDFYSWLESDDWFFVTGTDNGDSPVITVPGGLKEYVSWQSHGDTLTVVADFSKLESPLVLFTGGKGLEITVPESMLNRIECVTPLPAVSLLTLKGAFRNLELCSAPDLMFDDVRADTVTVRKRSNRSNVEQKFVGFQYRWDKSLGIKCSGSVISSLILMGSDSIDNKFDVSLIAESKGRGLNKKYIGSIGRLYVASDGLADSTYVKLSYSGLLPEEISFQTGIRNDIDLNTPDSYNVTTTGKVDNVVKEDDYEVYL